jgi:ABC-type dipeptide/oligopeptide/nickel transport system permease subunit
MAVSELGGIAEIEGWTQPVVKPLPIRMLVGLGHFFRRKPLGAFCGAIVVFFFVVGDVIPETLNKIASTPVSLPSVGNVKPDWGKPIPYVADQLDKSFSFIYPYSKQDLRARLQGSSSKHLLGTDAIGRDILSRLLYGARTAVMVSFGAVFISQSIGATIGIMSGYYGGWVDKGLYRIVDVFQALPGLVVLITIPASSTPGSGSWCSSWEFTVAPSNHA